MEELRDRQQQLSLSYNQLRSEAVRLKTEVWRHDDCDCGYIRSYISAEANKIVDRLTWPDDFRWNNNHSRTIIEIIPATKIARHKYVAQSIKAVKGFNCSLDPVV
ncbi:hypothetical protein FOYG_13028 [Fusarium oxysporum NRRL 32931]|uniref:Uncharacterized protein n=1 Tax=Fusarium oxysporum NRRL 32931 TaxID=660029 RepID=W9HQC0_FUSOX|nr:hypothetical protein FOYG_13028 [Fusarium oxysporum NRRL 32931]